MSLQKSAAVQFSFFRSECTHSREPWKARQETAGCLTLFKLGMLGRLRHEQGAQQEEQC